jgi:hypothetical protein
MVNHPNRSRRRSQWSIGTSSRCVDGRIMRHDPQPDDPYLETDRGECEECGGKGCIECPDCGDINCQENH